MNLFAAMLVLATSGALAASLLLHVLHGPLLARLRHAAPQERIRWVLAVLGAPALSGMVTVLVAFGPCIHNFVLGLPDGCRDHGGPEVFLCLRMPMQDLPGAWAVATVVVVLVARRLLVGALAALRAGRALTSLRRLGSFDAGRGIWMVPGDLAIVSGWPRSRIYVGEGLELSSSLDTLRVVLAHERAHVRRGDVTIKLFARALGLAVPKHIREHLLDELGLAMEQVCDASAADEIKDPLTVARSLLELAKLPATRLSFGLACVAPAEHLEARIRALCEPRWTSSGRIAAMVGAAAIGIAAACLAFDPALHDLVEAAFDRLLV